MKHSSIPTAQSVIQHCKAKGLDTIVISPGSRNAPLIIGFSEDPFFRCFSIVDERCAGFFALGIAQQNKKPVVLVCTSGSALLNYYPAIAEAFYSDIPLVVISADRPTYKIDIGDGQTIRQDDVFKRHIGYSANLRQDLSHSVELILQYAPQWLTAAPVDQLQHEVMRFNAGQLNNAINIALKQFSPVHINIPFEEPLYKVSEELQIDPVFVYNETERDPEIKIEGFWDVWNVAERKMILVGVNPPNSVEQSFLNVLANDPSVVILTETTSNLHHTNFFSSIDSIIAPIEKLENSKDIFQKLRPDLLLTFGGLVVSKKIKAFLRGYPPKQHWHVDPIKAYDTFFSLSHHIKIDVNSFFKLFLQGIKPRLSTYFEGWNGLKKGYIEKREAYLKKIPFCDMFAFDKILKSIPQHYQLQLANSSTVRYAQLFDLDPTLKTFCNRGTSGIDGSTSTAVGASIYSAEPTVLITGDLGFLYDSNALWNNYLKPDFRIIVINNGGGGIFRILPGKEDTTNFETFFETAHSLNAKKLCEMYGISYRSSDDESSLKNSLNEFYGPSEQPRLLEIFTARLTNDKILLGYFDFISSDIINH